MSATPSPFDPVTIGPLTLRNRFIKSGANEAMSRNGSPTQAMVKHHSDLAAGGVGMTTVASCAVALAVRGKPSSRAISPNTSPGSMIEKVSSLPLSLPTQMRTSPSTTAYSASPSSPQRLAPAFCRLCRPLRPWRRSR